MHIQVLEDRTALGRAAADHVARAIRRALARAGSARIIAATGTSQFELLAALPAEPDIDWSRVEVFHLDEYLGLPADHPASFSRFLLERLIRPLGIGQYHLLAGGTDTDGDDVVERVTRALESAPIDLALTGVGENGHLAFNDPPADFDIEAAYLRVDLDERCRQQQVGEGWFENLAAVPKRAVTMSVRQILKAKEIICLVPDGRKAQAVMRCFGNGVTPAAPASALLEHPRATVYLDRSSARLLPRSLVDQA
ncbi:MAG: glucosamine-6-phosphate deaminase [Vicinamibacterales bacterium]